MNNLYEFKKSKFQLMILCLLYSVPALADLTNKGRALTGKEINPSHLKAHIEPVGELRDVESGDLRIKESESIRMKVALYYDTGEPGGDALLSEEIFDCNAKDEAWNIVVIYNESLRKFVYSGNRGTIPSREQKQAAVAEASSKMTTRGYSPWPAICNGAYEKFKSHEQQIYSAKTLGRQIKLHLPSGETVSWLALETEEKPN